jgi:phage repressor protein C with HTH and peptisase S24 domain
MLTHLQIWNAVDSLAERHGLSSSGLARKAGLDSTTFNRSKRIGSDGRLRWPSTESIAKALEATGDSLDAFMELIAQEAVQTAAQLPFQDLPFQEKPFQGTKAHSNITTLPLIDMKSLQSSPLDIPLFDEKGVPVGKVWEEVVFPTAEPTSTFILDITEDDYAPDYKTGDQLIVSTQVPLRRSDRVVIKLSSGEVLIGTFIRETAQNMTLKTHILSNTQESSQDERICAKKSILLCARIMWASQ